MAKWLNYYKKKFKKSHKTFKPTPHSFRVVYFISFNVKLTVFHASIFSLCFAVVFFSLVAFLAAYFFFRINTQFLYTLRLTYERMRERWDEMREWYIGEGLMYAVWCGKLVSLWKIDVMCCFHDHYMSVWCI